MPNTAISANGWIRRVASLAFCAAANIARLSVFIIFSHAQR